METTVERAETEFPPLPETPAGYRLGWVGLYEWSDRPRPECWAVNEAGEILVSVWKRGSWGRWKKNE